MLTKSTPTTIAANLKIKAQGVENSLKLTYHNHSADDYDAFAQNTENFKVPEALAGKNLDIAIINAALVLFVVQSFDDGTDKDFPLSLDGMIDLERTWPGTLLGIIRGYHQARGANVEKN